MNFAEVYSSALGQQREWTGQDLFRLRPSAGCRWKEGSRYYLAGKPGKEGMRITANTIGAHARSLGNLGKRRPPARRMRGALAVLRSSLVLG